MTLTPISGVIKISQIPEEEICDVAVLGAGISGLVGAHILLAQGAQSITLIDSYDQIGGNHRSIDIKSYTFDLGSFLFSADSPLMTHFPEVLAAYTTVKCDIGRVMPDGNVSAYPLAVRDEIFGARALGMYRIATSLIISRILYIKPRNAADYAKSRMGTYLYNQSGLAFYMEKFYGVAPEEIDLEFARKRMTWIGQSSSLRFQVSKLWKKLKAKTKASPKALLVRPQEGFAKLYAPIREKLESSGAKFALNEKIKALTVKDGIFHIRTADRIFRARRLVSTLPIGPMLELCGLPDQPLLRTVDLVSLLYSFSGERGFDQTILYNFSASGRWKRITTFSDFYGRGEDGREYFTLEVNRSPGENPAELDRDFRRDMVTKGLLRGELRLEGQEVVNHAYPVLVHGAPAAAAEAIASLRALGVESFGRQGGFDYLATASATTHAARAALG